MSKKVIVFGGDGFCGFPSALHLSLHGFEVLIVDNLSRRRIDSELDSFSLSPIQTIEKRLDTWEQMTGKRIRFMNFDVSKEYDKLFILIQTESPTAVVHFAEQRSAPYSMRNESTSRYTVDNNLNATHNILCAIARSKQDIHVVHLGTMGVYGYGMIENYTIPEGYLKATIGGQEVEILHPAYPGSVYHMTKTQDSLFFQFYNKNYKMRITDLHQGIVWGTQTKETSMHKDLVNRIDYDETYGTVLNRFVVQTVAKKPMTIYGSGGQTRAFININDTVRCIRLAIENPPHVGERVKIFNQVTQSMRLIDIANLIQHTIPDSKYIFVENPRNELEKNDLNVSHTKFPEIGLEGVTIINEESIKKIHEEFKDYITNFQDSNVLPSSFWKIVKT